MIQKIKSFILVSVSLLTFGAPMLVPIAASAASCNGSIQTSLAAGVTSATGTPENCSDTGSGASSSIQNLAKKIVNIFSVIVGIVAVIFVIYGGFRYITSGGDSGNVGNAKNTLIYALVGLVIVALAQLIVHYVLSTAAGATSASGQ